MSRVIYPVAEQCLLPGQFSLEQLDSVDPSKQGVMLQSSSGSALIVPGSAVQLSDVRVSRITLHTALRELQRGPPALRRARFRELTKAAADYMATGDFVHDPSEAPLPGPMACRILSLPVPERVSFLRRLVEALAAAAADLSVSQADINTFERLSLLRQAIFLNFDWDDNIAFMATQIVLFHKQSGEEVLISTGEFAEHAGAIGTSGPWKDYELRRDLVSGSFRNFNDLRNPDIFVSDTADLSKQPIREWGGPMLSELIRGLGRSAIDVNVITARMHTQESGRDAMMVLAGIFELLYADFGYRAHIPPLQNFFLVGKGNSEATADAKGESLELLADRAQAKPFGPAAKKILNSEGTGLAYQHCWVFSEDHDINYDRAVEVMRKGVRAGRWPDVKIALAFTGVGDPAREARVEVMRPDGSLRPARPEEANEISRILGG